MHRGLAITDNRASGELCLWLTLTKYNQKRLVKDLINEPSLWRALPSANFKQALKIRSGNQRSIPIILQLPALPPS